MVALMAVTFVQPNDTALAGSPSEVCPNRMDVAVNGQTVQLPYCSNKLLDTPDPSVKRAVIVVHGSSRNAEDYYPRMRDAAKMAGALDESIILAPQFFEDEDKGTFKLDQTNIPYWDGGWREGDPSVSPKTPKVSSYAMLDEMIKRLTNRSTFPNLQRVVVTGHSAGGQFTQRYAAGNQVEQQTVQPAGITMGYVVANPSSYVYFDTNRRMEGSVDQFAVPQTSCSDYNTYKYGLDGVNEYMQAVGVDQIRSQYAQRDVVYLLGEKDTLNDSGLDTRCPAMLQGKHRLERGTIFYNYVGSYYGPTVYDNQSKVLVPGVDHDSDKMFKSSQGQQVIFGDPVAVTPTPGPSVTTTPGPQPSVTTTPGPQPGAQAAVFMPMVVHARSAPGPAPSPVPTTTPGPNPTNPPLPAGANRLLYVTNDDNGKIEIYDIEAGHKLLRSIDVASYMKQNYNHPGTNRFRGITAHAGTQRLYFTNADTDLDYLIAALDLSNDKIAWVITPQQLKSMGCLKPDRLNVTIDGSALYVPCKKSDKELILNASDGKRIKMLTIRGEPHNTFTGEQGKWMYMSARSSTVFHIADPKTHTIVKSISGMSSEVRPFSVNPSETFVFANLTKLMGFGVMDIRDPDPSKWTKLMEVKHTRPEKLPPYMDSPHGDNPQSHGIAVRPGGNEVWFIDDHYGFLYVYDITTLPAAPQHVATVPLFTDYSKVWTDKDRAWVAFDATGKYVYAANGWIIDADTRQDTGMRISPSEKLVEIDFVNGVPVRSSGQNGGVYSSGS
jgi:dienelactone hydrolase